MAISGSQKAYRYALSNIARSGATRSAYVSAATFITIGGVALRHKVMIESLTITDALDETPNRCTFRMIEHVPTTGQPVVITMGSTNGARLFAGHVLTVDEVTGGKATQVRSDVSCVDYTWQLGFIKVTQRYRNLSATDIAIHLVTTYAAANGFTGTRIAAGLPILDEITFTDEDLPDALTRLCRRIGAYWYVDYAKDVHVFFEEVGAVPHALVSWHPTLAIEGFGRLADTSQALTRVYVEGRGTRLLTDVAAGETQIPIEAADMFAVSSDVFVKAAFQGSEGGAQHLNFSGVVAGGLGALVGPGIGPSAAVSLAVQAGAGPESGTHGYAVTFVTASGESLASPTASIMPGPIPNPTAAPTNLRTFPTYSPQGYAGHMTFGDAVNFAYNYRTVDGGQTMISPYVGPITVISNQDSLNPANSAAIWMTVPYSPDPRVRDIRLHIFAQSDPNWEWCLSLPNVVSTGSVDVAATIYGIDPSPSTNTTGQNQVLVSNIPTGAATVTQRKLYRTAANLTQLKLLTTIANNTATTYTDSTPDASLGANIPIADTSGLLQPAGQIPAGATTIPVAGTIAFQAAGGWAVIGNGEQVIRYTGITGGTLTGIPTSGIGAVVAAIAYNSTITASAMLTGIPATGTRSIREGITGGGELYLVVQVDDTARQAQLATRVGGAGIREEWVQDRRLSIAEARARGQATLQQRPLDHLTIQYRCRDVQTAAGKTVEVNLTPGLASPLNILGYFKIQQVTITNFRPHLTQYPTYTVQASSTRFSFDDWLRQIKG